MLISEFIPTVSEGMLRVALRDEDLLCLATLHSHKVRLELYSSNVHKADLIVRIVGCLPGYDRQSHARRSHARFSCAPVISFLQHTVIDTRPYPTIYLRFIWQPQNDHTGGRPFTSKYCIDYLSAFSRFGLPASAVIAAPQQSSSLP